MTRVLLYHPDNALEALEVAASMDLLDYAFPSRYMPEDEIWISEEPGLIDSYMQIMDDQIRSAEEISAR
jgi:hypothetical protein